MANFFWDSCVFNAFLYEEDAVYDTSSIEQYLEEAAAGQHKIFTSSVVMAEVAESRIKRPGIGTMQEFINDFIGAINVVDATVNIFELAGRLKDIPYKKQQSKVRKLSTGDAVMLATALHLVDAFGESVDVFHTFDDGGAKRSIPILSYHEWCEDLAGPKAALAARVIGLRRERPVHPAPRLPLQAAVVPAAAVGAAVP